MVVVSCVTLSSTPGGSSLEVYCEHGGLYGLKANICLPVFLSIIGKKNSLQRAREQFILLGLNATCAYRDMLNPLSVKLKGSLW